MVETVDRRSGSGSPEDDKKPEENKKPEGAKPAPEPEPAFADQSLPKPEFLQLIQMFMYQSLIALGQAPNPITQKTETDLEAAKHHIGFLEIIEEKTKGNLSETEAKYLKDCLHQCRLSFVSVSKGPASEAETLGD